MWDPKEKVPAWDNIEKFKWISIWFSIVYMYNDYNHAAWFLTLIIICLVRDINNYICLWICYECNTLMVFTEKKILFNTCMYLKYGLDTTPCICFTHCVSQTQILRSTARVWPFREERVWCTCTGSNTCHKFVTPISSKHVT